MSQPEKSTKRIVSKTEYVALETRRSAISLSGTMLVFMGWGGAACGVVIGLVTVAIGILQLSTEPLIVGTGLVFGLGFGYLMIRGGITLANRGVDMMQRAEEMEEVLPMTRANAGDLSPSDSLVRAASEPVQEQQSVLLRASIHSQQTPADQLLRSVEE